MNKLKVMNFVFSVLGLLTFNSICAGVIFPSFLAIDSFIAFPLVLIGFAVLLAANLFFFIPWVTASYRDVVKILDEKINNL